MQLLEYGESVDPLNQSMRYSTCVTEKRTDLSPGELP